ncbi:hypothetical protein EB796_019488 [Bugula neritina]|uniref:Uncharacterized protein n=1 Tax=Bugula neritina TaxID=10212 RepID=A0A7J7J7N0_BUGNE|nr:hypothetical protein EB796_019488 [Bugula neritina]
MNYQTEVLKFTQILTSIRESNEDRNVVTELKKCLPFISLDKRYNLLVENKTIHLAAVKGYVDTIRHLLDDISVEQKVELLKLQNSYGNTAIHRAAFRGHTDTIKCLLDGVSVDQKVELVKILNRYGDTAIHRAVWENYTETIKSLLDCVLGDQKVELLKLQNSCGNTAIHCAAWDGDTDTIQCLLDYISLQQKVELLKIQSGEDATAIHCAVWDGNTDIIKCLLDGVSVDRKVELLKVQRSDGNTAMHCSAMRGHTETINCLLDGVSVDQKVELLKIQNGYGTTAIHRTALSGHKDTINSLLDCILVDQKVELLRIQDTDGWTAIHRAALRGHTDTIKCLLDGVPVEQQVELLMIEDIDGDTAMQKAAEANQTETFALLTSQLTAEQNTNHFNISNNAGKLLSDVGVDEEIFELLPVPAKHRVGSTNQIEVQPSSLQTVPQLINLKPALSQPFLQPTNGSHLMPSVPTPSTPQWFSRPENPTVSVPSQSPQLNAPSSNHSADWSPFNPPSFTNMISTNPSHLDHESNIHREVNTYFERPLPPMASSSNKVSPRVHIHEGIEKTMDNLMHSTKVPYLIDSVVAAPHQNIPATVVVRQTVSLSTRSDEPFKSQVKNCKVAVKVQGENTVYSFEDHMTIGDLRRSIKEDCETGVMCRVVDEDKSRYSDSLRLGLVDVPFSIFVGDQETLVTERVNDKQAGQELSAPNAAKDFQYVQTPEQAIQLMEYVHKQLASKRAKSIHDALKPTGKCRKTIDRFRYIYYLSVLDKNKLVEIIGQWMDKAKKGGMCALGKLCEEATDWSKVVEAANDGKLTIFGMKKDK